MTLENKTESHFGILEANVIFLVLAAFFLTLGAYFQSREVLSGLLITEYGIVMMPVILYSLFKKKDIRAVFRLKKLGLVQIFKIMGIAALMIPMVALVNLIAIFIIEIFSKSVILDLPTAKTGIEYLGLMFIISLSAGICEEVLFRGMILDAYESELGRKWGAIFSGFLFALFHFNPQNFLGPFLLGVVFSYLVQLTGSIYAAIIAHATNNGIAVTMAFLINLIYKEDALIEQGEHLFESMGMLFTAIIFYGLLAFVLTFALRAAIRNLKIDYATLSKGETINIESKSYVVAECDGDTLILKDFEENRLLKTNLDRIKRFGVLSNYKVWQEQKLRLDMNKMVPVVGCIIAYGYVVYLVYA